MVRGGRHLLWDRGFGPEREQRRGKMETWCRKCEVPIGGFWKTMLHLGLHVVDLAVAAGVAATVTAALIPRLGHVAILGGAMMGLGLASFRERTRR